MLSWLILITHYSKGEKKQHKDPSSESLSTAPSAQKSSSPILLLSRLKKSKASGLTHCPDSRLCFCKAAYGFSSRRCRVCRKYFSQGMLSKTKHWKSSVGFFLGRISRWELIESYRSHSMWGEKSRSSQEPMKEVNGSVIWSAQSFTTALFLP